MKTKSVFGTRQREFRTACSAAGPELGDYTQWVRWRAPTEKNKNQKEEGNVLGRPSALPDAPGASLKGVAFSMQLCLNVQKRLI